MSGPEPKTGLLLLSRFRVRHFVSEHDSHKNSHFLINENVTCCCMIFHHS